MRPPDDLAAVEAESVQLFRKSQHTVQYRFLKKDGSWCWVNDEQRLIRDQDGQPEEVVGSWTDITERRSAEEAVAAVQARVEHLVASAQRSSTASRLPATTRRPSSARTSRICWLRPGGIPGSPDFWVSRVHPDDSPRILRAYERLMDVGQLSSEYRFRKKDGSYCWVSDELRVLRDAAGNPVEVVGAWSDVTARKHLGEALVAARTGWSISCRRHRR